MRFKITDLSSYNVLTISFDIYDWFLYPLFVHLNIIYCQKKVLNFLVSLGFDKLINYVFNFLLWYTDMLVKLPDKLAVMYIDFVIWTFPISIQDFIFKFCIIMILYLLIKWIWIYYNSDFINFLTNPLTIKCTKVIFNFFVIAGMWSIFLVLI